MNPAVISWLAILTYLVMVFVSAWAFPRTWPNAQYSGYDDTTPLLVLGAIFWPGLWCVIIWVLMMRLGRRQGAWKPIIPERRGERVDGGWHQYYDTARHMTIRWRDD